MCFEKLLETGEYDYDNVIMWKPCSLILTIPPHLNDFRFMEIFSLSQSSSPLLFLDIDTPPSPSPATRYISKVSSPDGLSIQNLWSVTKFKFTKLQVRGQWGVRWILREERINEERWEADHLSIEILQTDQRMRGRGKVRWQDISLISFHLLMIFRLILLPASLYNLTAKLGTTPHIFQNK